MATAGSAFMWTTIIIKYELTKWKWMHGVRYDYYCRCYEGYLLEPFFPGRKAFWLDVVIPTFEICFIIAKG